MEALRDKDMDKVEQMTKTSTIVELKPNQGLKILQLSLRHQMSGMTNRAETRKKNTENGSYGSTSLVSSENFPDIRISGLISLSEKKILRCAPSWCAVCRCGSHFLFSVRN